MVVCLCDYCAEWKRQEIGKGTYGTVFRASWRGVDVAVKELALPEMPKNTSGRNSETALSSLRRKLEAARDDFVKEIEVCCDLLHPNLVRILGYASSEKVGMMIVQELCEGVRTPLQI